MCPSFMVTHEERHTTRGRAHHLWEMLQRQRHRRWLARRERERIARPVPLLQRMQRRLPGQCGYRDLQSRISLALLGRPAASAACVMLLGLIDHWARLASLWPGLVNLVTQTPGLSHAAKFAAGMPLSGRIPEFAPADISQLVQKARTAPMPDNGQSDPMAGHFQ